ncbi:MAG: hypothetical protein ACPGJE_10420, partial [Wenzhouxiangellaceae bacterium]
MKISKCLFLSLTLGLVACGERSEPESADSVDSASTHEMTSTAPATPPATADREAAAQGTCTGTYPSYWQDPAFPEMYESQLVSNQPEAGYQGPVFRLSDAYPEVPVDERADQPWRDDQFDALFDPETDPETRSELANAYSWSVMAYIQAGNIGNRNIADDWDVCDNPVRSWFHIPFQTYDVMSGREFTHGLTREAPVGFSMNTSTDTLNGTMWAVGFFNPTAGYTLGT